MSKAYSYSNMGTKKNSNQYNNYKSNQSKFAKNNVSATVNNTSYLPRSDPYIKSYKNYSIYSSKK